MKAALAIAAAELRAHRLTLVAAIASGLVGHVVLTMSFRMHRQPLPSAADMALVAFFLMTSTQICMAVVMGVAAVSSDLAERRLGFYLARPFSPLAYWGAKMAVAFLVAYAWGWLCLLPGRLLEGPGRSAELLAAMTEQSSLRGGLVATAFAVAAAAAAAGAVRSRSRLLPLDLGLLALTAAALLAALGRSWELGTTAVLLERALPWLAALALGVVLCAAAAQVVVGRLDLPRGHAWLSVILWSGLLACVAAVSALSRAVADATPSDLRLPQGASIQAPDAGTRVLLEGLSTRWGHSHRPSFFLDAEGRFVRAGDLSWSTGSAWSADGRRFVWSKPAFPIGDRESSTFIKVFRALPGIAPSLSAIDLDEPGAAPRVLPHRGIEFEAVRALSPSGQRLLIANSNRRAKSVLDAASGGTLASIGDGASWASPRFLSETALRALRVGAAQTRVVEWDTTAGRLTERGVIPLAGDRGAPGRFVPTRDWQGVLRLDGSGLFLHDLEGRVVATLVEGWPGRNRVAGLLSDGRIGSIEETREGLLLRVFDASGRSRTEARFKGRFPIAVGGEAVPGLLAVGVLPSQEDGVRESLFVDLATGAVRQREHGLWPALRRWRNERSENVEPASLGTRLFLGEEGLVLLDPASGGRRVLVQRRPS